MVEYYIKFEGIIVNDELPLVIVNALKRVLEEESRGKLTITHAETALMANDSTKIEYDV